MKQTIVFILGLTAIALFLGCSKSNNDETPSVTTTSDSFITTVRSAVTASSEDTEPTDIDAIAVTAPEESDPEDL